MLDENGNDWDETQYETVWGETGDETELMRRGAAWAMFFVVVFSLCGYLSSHH